MKNKMPVIFIGHGSPLNMILDNDYTRDLSEFGKSLERPKAILVISAHFYTKGSYITYSDKPKQIYDFYGFPDEMYKMEYRPDGGKEYALKTYELLKDFGVKLTEDWGLDHGSWGILHFLFPKADVPTFQLSINADLTEEEHYNMAKKLLKLREEGVLIIGSGNISHNLRVMEYEMDAKPLEFALEFDEYIKKSLLEGNHENVINYKKLGEIASLAVPTPDHYLPLIYTIALQEEGEKIDFIHENIQNGSMAMRSFIIN
ncbi:4,5-DOPA dioxygenase extradiol [Clostridium isatidis]|uniref:4,5-DOPA dioxygenase extradiol n=2 Tax=Clostridium isatidis TaxID=182773 RepID=A0A343JFW5_9CLOT|nr:4,5-DOPA dioxygenase extradiol [Clostridium isatidis]